MKWPKTSLSIALTVLALCVPHGVEAAPPRLPTAVYPAGFHINYRPQLTNAEMDCMWGFVCEGGSIPNFHFRTEGDLGRMAGWGQFAARQHNGRTTMAFELFVSRYDAVHNTTGTSSSERAFRDLTAAIRAQRYQPDRRGAQLLPAEHQGGTLVALQHLDTQDLVVMACWSGDLEVEGITLYDRGSKAARQTAQTSLALQIHLALVRGA